MDVMHYVQIAVLALIQGAAELLPVSSSAHVILAQRVMGMDPSKPEQVFLLVMLHTGTMFAVLVYFWPRWRRLLTGGRTGAATEATGNGYGGAGMSLRQFLEALIMATAVTGVVTLALKFVIENIILVKLMKYPKGEVEELFKHLPLVAAGLAAVGVFILATGARDSASGGRLTNRSGFWIGLVQGFCMPFRGFSRSGATISTGLFCGVSRVLCEDFSFALAVVLTPPVQVYALYKLLKAHELSTSMLTGTLVPALVGMVLSFLAGLLALRFLSAVLERGRWKYFGFYCLAAAVVIWIANGLLPATS
jgi:undecaprenyl-diphosphatase